jgi:RNA polymerase sigma-54 factor
MPNQSLALSQDQRLQMVLAPQLRQSLEMLQAPMLELRAMIRAELEKNPTLEEMATESTPIEIEAGSSKIEDQKELDFRKEFETLARLDEEWREYFLQAGTSQPYTPEEAEKRQFFLDSLPQKVSLQEHLMRQLALADIEQRDREVGELIIGSINEDGYLTSPVEELAATAGIDPEHLRDVLSVIQEFDPSGVGARDLKECLLLQIERLGRSDSMTAAIVRDYLELLGAKKYPDIARALKTTPEEVQQAANFIATLDPKPGRIYSSESSPYVLPEVTVRKHQGQYIVILNDDQLPRVRISKQYRTMMEDESVTPEVKEYIQERIRSSVFMIKSIHQRQQTIHKIASEIVRVQTDFLDNGIAHLKPLTMAEIAAAVGLHETTVSRAVAGKHMQTPRGTFEMKYFFTPGLKTANGGDVSNKTVKDLIATILSREDASNPMSDQEILEQLTAKGIQIARRTIAKYRVALRIPPSHLRRQY